ncbi:MAG: NAD+ synthase [Alicyclobacillaceae bacterium]|nr:NAD+ synthase [Alicyclobacillaceae bacterium]
MPGGTEGGGSRVNAFDRPVEELLGISAPLAVEMMTLFLKEEVGKAGFSRVVFGLSGGIDSAVVAYLAARAFPRDQILAVLMPYRTSSPSSMEDAKKVVGELGIPYEVVDISPMVDAFFAGEPDASLLRRGNRMARERMCVLYDRSARDGALVIGTSNKTELLLGYGTQFGDLASAVNPIGDLYKTQVRQVARFLGVPQSILDKPPSADLWEDQTDEKELGFTYEEVDRLLYYMVDLRYSKRALIGLGFSERFVDTVARRVRLNQYKRRPPVILKLSNRTIGVDFRYPRDWGI